MNSSLLLFILVICSFASLHAMDWDTVRARWRKSSTEFVPDTNPMCRTKTISTRTKSRLCCTRCWVCGGQSVVNDKIISFFVCFLGRRLFIMKKRIRMNETNRMPCIAMSRTHSSRSAIRSINTLDEQKKRNAPCLMLAHRSRNGVRQMIARNRYQITWNSVDFIFFMWKS